MSIDLLKWDARAALGVAYTSGLRQITLEPTDGVNDWRQIASPVGWPGGGYSLVLTDVYIAPTAGAVHTLIDIGFLDDDGAYKYIRYQLAYEGIQDHLTTKLICPAGQPLLVRKALGNQHVVVTALGYVTSTSFHTF